MASVAVRSPYESFFAANNKDDQKLLLSSGLKFVKQDLDNNGVHFAYHLGSEKKELLTSLGISLHPVPFLAHSHPFCKTLENNLLLNVLPEVMGNGKWVFSSIKKKKVDTVVKKGGLQASNVSFVNKVICAKDFSRYDFEPSMHEHRINMASRDFIFPKVYLKACHNCKVFIHDEVHHWSLGDMIYFLQKVEPKSLVFTVVYPPELLKGILQPQNAHLYDFRVDKSKGKLFFFPDGCKSEGYEQPERLDWLFQASYIDTGDRIYTVKMIKSTFSHHMFQIIPGEFVTETKRFFGDFNTIDLTVIHKQRFRYYDYVPIKKVHVQKVYSYLLCLKKPDVESGLAKLRQMFEDEQDCRVVDFFSRFCKDVIDKCKGKWDLYGYGWVEKAKSFFLEILPGDLGKSFEAWKGKNVFEFLFTLENLVVEVDTKVVKKSFISSFSDEVCVTSMFTSSLPEILEKKWIGAPIAAFDKCSLRAMSLPFFFEFEKKKNVYRMSALMYLGHINLDLPKLETEKEREKKREEEIKNSLDFSAFSSNPEMFLKEKIKDGSFFSTIKKISCQNPPLLCYSRPGPFVPPAWFIESQLKKKNEEEKLKKEKERAKVDDEFANAELSVSFDVVGWYVKVNLNAMISGSNDFTSKEILKEAHPDEPRLVEIEPLKEEKVEALIKCNGSNLQSIPEEVGIKKLFKVDAKDEGEENKAADADPLTMGEPDCSSVPTDDEKPNPKEVVSNDSENDPSHKTSKIELQNSSLDEGSDSLLSGLKEDIQSVGEIIVCRDDLKDFCLIENKSISGGVPKKKVKVVADGNCFYRALMVCFGKSEEDYMNAKKKVASGFLKLTGSTLSSDLVDEIERDGEYASDEVVQLIVNIMNIDLRISTDDVYNNFASHVPKGISHDSAPVSTVHLHLKDEHYDAVLEDSISSELVPMEFGMSSFEDLKALKFDNFKPTLFKGRRAYFLVDNMEIDYSHNGTRYKPNLFDVKKLCPDELYNDYNVCLVQVFNAGASIGFHRDNESCYDGDDILSVNLIGEATFLLEENIKGQEKKIQSFRMFEGHYIKIDAALQRRFRHSVIDCSDGRVNVTFRKHVRTMGGLPISNLSEQLNRMKNRCLIDAIARAEQRSVGQVMGALFKKDECFWKEWVKLDCKSGVNDLIKASCDLLFSFEIEIEGEISTFGSSTPFHSFKLEKGHFTSCEVDKIGKIMTELELREEIKCAPSILADEILKVLTLSPGYNVLDFRVDPDYALKLVESFKDRTTGISLSEIYSNGGSIFKTVEKDLDMHNGETFSIHSIIGFGGSGKSRMLQTFLSSRGRGKYLIISPRSNLMSDWVQKVKCKPSKIKTFEVALRVDFRKVDVIVLDEMSLLPNGYLDLLMLKIGKRAKDVCIVCIFDVFQARYHSDLDTLRIGEVNDVDRLVSGKDINYLLQTYRMKSLFFEPFFGDIMRIEKKVDEKFEARFYDCHLKAQILEAEAGRKIDVLLVASRDEKKALSGKLPVMTFGESQGLSFDRTMILLSENSEKQDELRWMVALTRARISVCFLVIYRGGLSNFIQNVGNKLIKAFIKGERCTQRRLELMSQSKSITFCKEPLGGSADEVDREERLEGDPFLKPFIFLGQRINSEEYDLVEIEVCEPKGKTHVYHAQANFAQSRNFDLIRSKELREARCKLMVSNQFCDSYERVGTNASIHTSGPMRFEAIYPRHRMDDDMTFWMAVQKRLRFSSEAKERAKLKEASSIGNLLYYTLKQKMGFSFSKDPNLLERCLNDFEYKKLLKSKATIANHSIRSDKDWPMNSIFLFMKSQLCTKYEKQYVDAKAGQTLACFQHMVLVKFAPYCRYMEAMIRSQLPEEVYIHSNKNFDDLNKWVVDFFKNDTCVESDYEAFDASQDEYILSFEIALMEDMEVPTWFINEYIDLKCTLGCKLGHFAIMRFTGEFCTFLFNTLANMAFTMCRYEWEKGMPIAFAGDDMCALRNMEVSDKFEEIFEKLSLQAKVIRTDVPMFCGWRLSKYGIVKEPELLYNRFMVAKERGNVEECIENYAIEASYAYSLGERLFEVLKSEDQIEYHQSVVRFIVQRLDKLKTKVKLLYSDQNV